jgi:hypothetical protein
VFSRVSEKLHLDNPRTFPHMKKILDRLSFLKRHVSLDRVINFKEWLQEHTDYSTRDLKDSHQIRIAMKPKVPPLNWKQTDTPVLQGKQYASPECEYFPEMGINVLKSAPSRTSPPPWVCEVRPLFCQSQPHERMDADGSAGDGDASRGPTLATDEMDCSKFKAQLQKLRGVIEHLAANTNFFWSMRFEEETSEAMSAWWRDFLDEQERIMDDPDMRSACSLHSLPTLKAMFDNVIQAARDDPSQQQRWLRRAEAQVEAEAAMHRDSRFSIANLSLDYRAPSTSTLQVAEHTSFEPALKIYTRGVEVTRGKVCLALTTSYEDNIPVSEVFAGYVGPGSKQRSRPKLWIWVCEVQKLLWHSDDWQDVKLRVHWYRPYPRCSKRWIAGFWEKGGTPGNHKLLLDLPDDVDPNDPSYWYLEDMEIPWASVVTTFDGFKQRSVTDMDEHGKEKVDAKGKRKKTQADYMKDNIHADIVSRCAWMDSLVTKKRGPLKDAVFQQRKRAKEATAADGSRAAEGRRR